MAVVKETSFWGKWRKKKELDPGSEVSLNGLAQHLVYNGLPLGEDVFIASKDGVRHVITDVVAG